MIKPRHGRSIPEPMSMGIEHSSNSTELFDRPLPIGDGRFQLTITGAEGELTITVDFAEVVNGFLCDLGEGTPCRSPSFSSEQKDRPARRSRSMLAASIRSPQ